MTTSDRNTGGFTLLEMLVVLLIAGMALALTSQALGQFKRAYERVDVHTQRGREFRMAERWFRDSVSGLHPVVGASIDEELPTSDPKVGSTSPLWFHGESHRFSGITLLPVLAGQGIPTMQVWSISSDRSGLDQLVLDEDGRQLLIPFPDANQLQLAYMDAEGRAHPQWPPTPESWPQLPAAITLTLDNRATIVTSITGPKDALKIPYEPDPF